MSEFAAILQDLAELNPENELRQLSLKRQQNQLSKEEFMRYSTLLQKKSKPTVEK